MTFTAFSLPLMTAIGILAGMLASPQIARAQDGKGGGQVLKDRLGDVLPPEAILRLGTLRLRSGGVVRALSFSSDGKTLRCAGWDNAIRRWDAQTGAELEPLTAPKNGFVAVTVAADGNTLVGGTVDGDLHVWDLVAAREVKKIAVPGAKTIRQVAVAPDGRSAAIAADDKNVRLLDLATGQQLRVLVTYHQSPSSVAFSADGKLVASAAHDGPAHVHEADTGREVAQLPLTKTTLYGLCFTADGKTLLAGEQNALSFWDAHSGQLQRRIEGVAGHLWTMRLAPDGKTCAGGTSAGTIHIWETTSGKELHRIKAHPDNVQALAFSPDGTVLASGGSESTVSLWDTRSGKQHGIQVGHQGRVTALGVAPDGKSIATAAWDHSIRLWDADTGQELRRLGWTPQEKVPLGTSIWVHRLIFSPHGAWLAAAGYEDKVWLWDLAKGEPARTFPGLRAAFSPDGKYLVTANWGRVVHMYDTATGAEVRQFNGHRSGIMYAQFTPDGQTLLTVSAGPPFGLRVEGETWDKQAFWLWDVATGKLRRQFGGERRSRGLALSPDGRTLSATGLRDKVVHLWELATGKERAALHGHGDDIFATTYTPDGRFLASGSMDRTIRLWQLPGGQHVRTFQGHRGWVLDLAFTPDGKKLVSGSLDTTALVWRMPDPTPPHPARLTPADLDKQWHELASPDAKAAYQAISALAAAPDEAVPFLRGKLAPAPAPDAKVVTRLIADLDSDDFAAREKATAALEKLAALMVPQLRAALAKPASLDLERRAEKILERVASQPLRPEELRELRAVETLEYIATPGARVVLEVVAEGAAGAQVTRDAQAALLRWSRSTASR